MLSVDTAFIIERLRVARGFRSQQKFVNNVCEVRQYRRYIAGSSEMPFEVLTLLIGRLDMGFDEVVSYCMESSKKEKNKVEFLYNCLMLGNREDIEIQFKYFEHYAFVEKQSKVLYEFCIIFYNYKKSKISRVVYYDKVKKLINFPLLVNYEIFSTYEMLIISNIIKEISINEDEIIIQKLTEVLSVHEVEEVNSLDYHMIVLYSLIKYYGENKNYVLSIELCDRAIKLAEKYHHYYLFSEICYFKSLCFNSLGNINKRNDQIHNCICSLEINNDISLKTKLFKLMEKDFRITIVDFECMNWKKNEIIENINYKSF